MDKRHLGGDMLIYADGAANRRRTGVGAVVVSEQRQVIQLANRCLPVMTSSEAEYAGLTLALELALGMGLTRVEIRLDSEVVVYQMLGRSAVRSERLKLARQRAVDLAQPLEAVRYVYIPRACNALADALAAEALAGRAWRGGLNDLHGAVDTSCWQGKDSA